MMRELLMNKIIESIKQWDEKDVYVISLYVSDECDYPCKPTVSLSYNTEKMVKKMQLEGIGECDAKWNYAYWLQNTFFCFGSGDSESIVKKWIEESNLPYFEKNDKAWEIDFDNTLQETEKIAEAFIRILIEIVIEIHRKRILTDKFGREIPILIHELEYYEKIAVQNMEANGIELTRQFVSWCNME